MKIFKTLLLLCCGVAIVACDDEVTTIGSSLNASQITITVDSAFTQVIGESVFTDSIIGRTTDPLLGNLTMKGYGTLHTGFLTQFMPSLKLDTTDVTPATLDSLKLTLSYYDNDLVGDSLAPMVMDVYRLNRTIKAPLYTNIDPTEYYSPADLLASHTFGSSQEGYVDENTEQNYKRISIMLPMELGREIFNEYKTNPDIFASPTEFAKFFPGVYLNISYGNGRVVNIKGVFMSMFYRAIDSDGEVTSLEYTYMGVTPEICSINHFTLTPDETLLQGVNEGKIYAQAPIGYTPIITFPVRNIIERYRDALGDNNKIQNILNSLTFTIPAIADEENDLTPPSHLLFIRHSEVKAFFEQKKIPDNVNSFYAAYDKDKRQYHFSELGRFIRNILDSGVEPTDNDEQIALIPVYLLTETSESYYSSGTTYVTSVTPYSELPTIVQLDLAASKIKINYTTQIP